MKWVLAMAAMALTGVSAQAETMYVNTSGGIYKDEGGVLTPLIPVPGTSLGFMAFDNFGNLFVTTGTTVLEFASTNGTLSTTSVVVATGLKNPGNLFDGIAFDTKNNMYIADSGSTDTHALSGTPIQTAKVYQFTYNSTTKGFNQSTLSNVWEGTNDSPSGQLIFDDGSLYLADWFGGGVHQMGVGAGPGPSTNNLLHYSQALDAEGVALDANGNMFVSILPVSGSGSIIEFAADGTKTTFASGGSVKDVRSMGFDDEGNLWATATGNILEFVNTDGVLNSTPLVTALNGVQTLAFLSVPEPSTCALFALGLFSFLFLRRSSVRKSSI